MNDIISDYFETDQYSQHIKKVTFKKGEVILRPYDDVENVYAIAEGLVKIFNKDARGKEYFAVIYGPGDFYPLAWLINQQRPRLYFQAVTDSTVYIVPGKIFKEHLKADLNLSNSFMQQVLEQFAYFASTVNNLGLKYGRERIYYRLLVLASRFGQKTDGQIVMPYISQSDLGVTVNTTRESVSKEISKLEKLDVIEYNRRNIIIKDANYLEKEIGEGVPIAFFNDI